MYQSKMDEKVKQLAETLKKNGLAASMLEAIEKAKSILNVNVLKSDTLQEKDQNIPLNELMGEVGVTPEQVESQKQEKLDDIEAEILDVRKDIKQAEKNPEKIEQVKEKIEQVKEAIVQVEEGKKEENENKPQDDMFKEEKKIDLTKVFGNKR